MIASKFVAGTIMVTNQKGETFFLVKEHEQKHSFIYGVYSDIKESKSPMGTILEILDKVTTLDAESLRLVESTQLKADNLAMPLFIFDVVERPEDPQTYLKEGADLSWRRSGEVTDLMAECDFNGVPVYQ